MRSHLFKRLSRLSFRLPVMVAFGALFAMLSVAGAAIWVARDAVHKSTETSLVEVASYRSSVMTQYFKSRVNEIDVLSSQIVLRNALYAFEGAYNELSDKEIKDKVANYTTGNPNKQKLAEYGGENDKSFYGIAHRLRHPTLRKLNQELGYYDLFLIRLDGTVLYTVEKESDFGTNLVTGPYRDSNVGKAFREVLKPGNEGKALLTDFENYAPSSGIPAAFIVAPIMNDEGKPVGVLAAQVSIDGLSKRLKSDADGVLDVALVGPDMLLRSQLPKVEKPTILSRSMTGDYIKEALQGRRSAALGSDVNGEDALLVAAPVTVMNMTWAIVVSQPLRSVNQPVEDIAMLTMAITGGLLLLALIGSVFMARSVTRPVASLSRAVGSLARGDTCDIPGLARKDEIGDLARSLQIVHAAGMDAMRIRSSLDKAAVNLLVADQTNKYVYASSAALQYFKDHASEIQRAYPEFSPDKVVGCTREDMRKYLGIDRVMQTANGTGYTVRSSFGGRTIDLGAVPVTNEKDEYLGAAVEWRDVTDELHTAMEVAGMVNAAVVGDFTQRVSLDGKVGPMREICDGFNSISQTVEMSVKEIGKSLQHLAEGDLTYRMEADLIGSFEELQGHVRSTFERLTETMTTIQATAEEVANAAAEINAGSNDLAKRTEQQATSLEETAATTEQLAASVKQTAESSRRATELAEDASAVAAKGGNIASEAVDAIGRIEKASQQISEIVGVIDDIAFQTNLLALNAAVEAARAGEAGKGFAVVASEVRTLAQRSGQAAKDIKGLIANSSEQVADGVKLVHGAGEALHQIVDAAARVSATVVDISSATAEQANGIEEMSQTVAQLDEMTQQNSAMAEESAAAADGLQQQIATLRSLVATFKTGNTAQPTRAQAEPKLLQNLVKAAFTEKTGATLQRQAQDDGWSAKAPPRRAGGGQASGWSEF